MLKKYRVRTPAVLCFDITAETEEDATNTVLVALQRGTYAGLINMDMTRLPPNITAHNVVVYPGDNAEEALRVELSDSEKG